MANIVIRLLIVVLALWLPIPTAAQVKIDRAQSEDQVVKVLSPVLDSIVRSYAESHAAIDDALGKLGVFPRYEGGNFSWAIGKEKYFSNIGSLVINSEPTPECKNISTSIGNDCDWMRMRHLTCHFFLLDKRLELVGVTPLDIPRNEKIIRGYPMCLAVAAVGPALDPKNSILVTLAYTDSAEPALPDSDPPMFYKTILLRFKVVRDAVLIEQDDRCLGTKNNIRSIGEARNIIKFCRGGRR